MPREGGQDRVERARDAAGERQPGGLVQPLGREAHTARRDRDDGEGAAALGQLQRHAPAERVAEGVRPVESVRVEHLLHRIGEG